MNSNSKTTLLDYCCLKTYLKNMQGWKATSTNISSSRAAGTMYVIQKDVSFFQKKMFIYMDCKQSETTKHWENEQDILQPCYYISAVVGMIHRPQEITKKKYSCLVGKEVFRLHPLPTGTHCPQSRFCSSN